MIYIFHNQLNKLLERILKKYNSLDIIIGGDFNTDLMIETPKSISLLDLMREHNFNQYVKNPTRITNITATCLDLVFSNCNKNKINVSVQDFGFSDHLGTRIKINEALNSKNKPIEWKTKKSIFNKQFMNHFKTELKAINWTELLTINTNRTLNENYEIFNNILSEILDRCIPKKVIKLNVNKKYNWLSRGIKTSCRNKRLLKPLVTQTVIIQY